MNNYPRQQLRHITAKYGTDICIDARRCENLLNDLCGAYRREINVLVNAIEEHIPLDLLAGTTSMPLEMLLERLEKRLADQTAMNSDAARWAVDSWALALGVVTDSEIERRTLSEQHSAELQQVQTTQPEIESTDQIVSNADRTITQLPNKPLPIPPVTPLPPNRPASQIPPVSVPAKIVRSRRRARQIYRFNRQIKPQF